MEFPVDTAAFQVVQDFGAASYRHQGRSHTGEDWYGGLETSYGTVVRAAAAGRVTFASPNGWGIDGGVIILEHTFRDGTIAYSLYGHITDETGIAFPAVFSCVRLGDPLAAVGDARPAPHLHFEIRIDQPGAADVPGAGYVWGSPAASGFRRPTKFLLNFRARAADGYRFTADIADEAGALSPPVVRFGNGLLTLDANRVLGISADGRVLWRTNLDRRAVALLPDRIVPDGALIVYADGGIQPVNPDGGLGGARSMGVAFTGPPVLAGSQWIFPTPDGGLAALDSGLSAVLWRLENVGRAVRMAASPRMIGVVTEDSRLITLALDGTILDTALLREPGGLTTTPGGDLLLYSLGGLWQIGSDGQWSLRRADAPPGGAHAAAVEATDGGLYAFDGYALRGYVPDLRWETALPGVQGAVSLTMEANGILLLTSSAGDVIAVQAAAGGLCNRVRLYGDARSRMWRAVGDDGLLRLHVADQIVGFDWQDFLMACG
ncbi:MAG: peptidoglycan DD-metalloendopeptidase family protein [Chloroflexi bacterium]|nr:peptidoglycan DD-metalloendopeptidase family protein [Chloroflexota bacterium]